MDTTRRYPRTMAEAFPRDPSYASSIERHQPLFARSEAASAAIGIVFIFCAVILGVILIGGR